MVLLQQESFATFEQAKDRLLDLAVAYEERSNESVPQDSRSEWIAFNLKESDRLLTVLETIERCLAVRSFTVVRQLFRQEEIVVHDPRCSTSNTREDEP